MHHYWLGIAIRLCGNSRKYLAKGLAIEAELGDRQGARTDRLLREKFPEVKAIWGNFFSADGIYQGRTEEIAAHYTQLGSYKSYQKAKRIEQFGVPELTQRMDHKFPIDRADKIAQYFPEKQRYFLSLGHKQMIRELNTSSNPVIKNGKKVKKENHRLKEERKENNTKITLTTESQSNPSLKKSDLEEKLSEKLSHNPTGYVLTVTWALLSFVNVLESEKKEECLL